MRKMTYIVMALALVLGFTQCKKEQVPANNETEGVRITLTVDGGNNNGSRVIVNPTGHTDPNYATVTFENGDVVYVGNNGAYCGYLEYDGTNFTGTVNPTSEADYLHFYFMGNKGEKSQPTSVSITDQTSEYPVISYAHSTKLYKSDVTSYTAKLQNYCAIVKFTTNTIPTATAVTVKGMTNTVAVNFGANNAATSTSGSPYTFTMSGDGDIILHAVSTTERWAILLEQGAVGSATVTATGYQNGTCSVPAISNNAYIAGEETVSISLTAAAAIGHALSASAVGEIICTDGLAYAAADKNNLPAGVTAVAMVAYKGNESDCTNGLAIALNDESDGNVPYDAMDLCEGKTPTISGGTWRLPSIMDWQYMFIGCGASGTATNNPGIMDVSGMISYLSTAGGTVFPEDNAYWSSTQVGTKWWGLSINLESSECEFMQIGSNYQLQVRACLAF